MLKRFLPCLFICLFAGVLSAAPVFDFSGRICDGDIYAIDMLDNGIISLRSPKCDEWFLTCVVTINGKKFALNQLSQSKLSIKEKKNRAVFSGVGKDGNKTIKVELELLLKDKDVIVSAGTNGSDNTSLKLMLCQAANKLTDKDVKVNDNTIEFKAALTSLAGDDKELVFCPEVPPRKLTIKALDGSGFKAFADMNFNQLGMVSGVSLAANNGAASMQIIKNLKVEANTSSETYGGVDFWLHNKLKMPNYKMSRNLVQNPGFEEGFKYWSFGPLGFVGDMSKGEFFAISNDNPRSGNSCLQIRGDKAQDPAKLASFAFPIEKNQTYTISYYARAEKPVNLGLFVMYERWGGDLFHWHGDRIVSKEWKRYSYSFTSRFTCTSFALGVSRQDGMVWVDDVQFEKGKLTPYQEKKAGVCFVTGARGNLLAPGQGKGSHFKLSGKAGSKFTFQYKVSDLFESVKAQGKTMVTLDAKGSANVKVGWVPGLQDGIYSIESNVYAGEKLVLREFDRVTVMESAADVPTKYDLFFAVNYGPRHANWKRKLESMKYYGMDTILNFSIPGFAEDKNNFKKAVKKAGYYHVGCLTSDGKGGVKEPKKEITLQSLEERAYNYAEKHSDIRAWKTINEPHTLANEEDMKTMVDYVGALYRGAKKVNPDNLVITPDPANMYPKAGIKYIDLFLKYGGDKYCDIIGIHPYRGRPEDPDMDSDIAALLKVLDRHNVKKDVWFTEGIYHNNYILPPYKLNSHRGCSSDHFRTGDFSYHIGWGEKIAFAYTMRSWIMQLKYADRVKMSVDWVYDRYSSIDFDLTPTCKAFAPNAAKRFLCVAEFKNDLAFGGEVRGYMFEDNKKRPVAVIWTYNFLVDSGKEKGVKLDISALPEDIELMDCFGGKIERQKTVDITSFPIFVRGTSSSIAALNEAFKKTSIISKNFKQTFVSVKSTALNEREITLKNLLPYKDLSGHLKVFIDKKQVFSSKVRINGGQEWEKVFTIPERKNKVQIAEIRTEFTSSDKKEPEVTTVSAESMKAVKASKGITVDGDLSDWPEGAMVSLEPRFKSFRAYLPDGKKRQQLNDKYPNGIKWKGPQDLSADLYLAWDKDNLFMAFDIKDDKLEIFEKLAGAWMGDGIQLYFDCWADAAGKYTRGFDVNDQGFDIWPNGPTPVLRRAFAPEQQLGFLKTGVVDKAKTALKKTADGYTIEVAIPAHDIFPVKLFKGSLFGFACIINDRDVGFRHQGLVTTPSGTEPYKNPHLYSTVILK